MKIKGNLKKIMLEHCCSAWPIKIGTSSTSLHRTKVLCREKTFYIFLKKPLQKSYIKKQIFVVPRTHTHK